MSQNECLGKIIKENLAAGKNNQNITLNVNESTSNWSLFNIFDQKKKEDVKKYSIKIESNE